MLALAQRKAVAGRNPTGSASLAGNPEPVAFHLPVPPSTNALFRNVKGRGRVKTAEYYDYTTLAITSIKMQRVKPVPGRVVLIVGVERARMTADISNRLKALEDVIVRAGIIEDDRLVTAIAICWLPPANGLAWVQVLPAQRLSLEFHPSTDAATGGWILAAPQGAM